MSNSIIEAQITLVEEQAKLEAEQAWCSKFLFPPLKQINLGDNNARGIAPLMAYGVPLVYTPKRNVSWFFGKQKKRTFIELLKDKWTSFRKALGIKTKGERHLEEWLKTNKFKFEETLFLHPKTKLK